MSIGPHKIQYNESEEKFSQFVLTTVNIIFILSYTLVGVVLLLKKQFFYGGALILIGLIVILINIFYRLLKKKTAKRTK